MTAKGSAITIEITAWRHADTATCSTRWRRLSQVMEDAIKDALTAVVSVWAGAQLSHTRRKQDPKRKHLLRRGAWGAVVAIKKKTNARSHNKEQRRDRSRLRWEQLVFKGPCCFQLAHHWSRTWRKSLYPISPVCFHCLILAASKTNVNEGNNRALCLRCTERSA